jgi:hypothetical protein
MKAVPAMARILWFYLLLGLFAVLAPASAKASTEHFSKNVLGNTESQNDNHHIGQALLYIDQSLPVNLQENVQPFKKQHFTKVRAIDFKMRVALLYLDYEFTIIPGLPMLTLMYPYHNFP